MSVSLLDVNVLVALFDPAHPNHDAAHRWFGSNRRGRWATCPVTINGCIRVLGSPTYPTVEATPGEVIRRLRLLCSTAEHDFWPEGISLLDERLIHSDLVGGPQKITDAYLLALAVQYGGRLVTFDRSIPVKAVVGAQPKHLVVLG